MGIYLSAPKTEKVSEDGENDRLRFGASSMQGWRSTMEDAHAAFPDLDNSTSFFGVYDGHGGKAVAKFCAKYLHLQVLNEEAYLAGDLGTSLQKAFLRMDEMMRGQRGWRELAVLGDKIDKVSGLIEGFIFTPKGAEAKRSAFSDQINQWSSEEVGIRAKLFPVELVEALLRHGWEICVKGPHSDFDGPNSGSTACVATIRNNQLVVANAGDSRCVISRKGQAYPLSKDHKPDMENEKERILKAGGFIQVGRVNGSLNLARAIGDVEFKQNKQLPVEKQIVTAYPDVTSVEIWDDDQFLVIACDGIWDCMSNQQLMDYVREQLKNESTLSVVCERVFERCLAPSTGGEGCDNMTMILVQFKKPVNSTTASTGSKPLSSDPSPEKPSTENKPLSSDPSPQKTSTGNKPLLSDPSPEKASTGNKPLSTHPSPEKPSTENKPLSSHPSPEMASTGKKKPHPSDPSPEKPSTENKPLSSDPSPEKPSTENKPLSSGPSPQKTSTGNKPLLSDPSPEKASTGNKPLSTHPSPEKPSTENKPLSSHPSPEKASTGNKPLSSHPSPNQASTGNKPLSSNPSLEKASTGNKPLSSDPSPGKDKSSGRAT